MAISSPCVPTVDERVYSVLVTTSVLNVSNRTSPPSEVVRWLPRFTHMFHESSMRDHASHFLVSVSQMRVDSNALTIEALRIISKT